MRILLLLIILFFAYGYALAQDSFASDCGSDKLGTYRTIKLAPEHSRSSFLTHIRGTEKSLGLRDGEIILTFDDGPQRGTTNKILKVLKSHCTKATFFAVGRMARLYPKLIKRVADDGHTIAYHTLHHERLTRLDVKKVKSTINAGVEIVERHAYGRAKPQKSLWDSDPKTRFFRYPYFDYNNETDSLLARNGWIAFGANIDSRDWAANHPDDVFNTLVKNIKIQKKGIVLMHDIQSETADMLSDLLRYLKRHGYRIVHMKPGEFSDSVLVASARPPARSSFRSTIPRRNPNAVIAINVQDYLRPTQLELGRSFIEFGIEGGQQDWIFNSPSSGLTPDELAVR